jgi:hypothetical protein
MGHILLIDVHDDGSIAAAGQNQHKANQHHWYPNDCAYYRKTEYEPEHHHYGAKNSHVPLPTF